MSDSNTDALKRAYELVEAGQPEEARSILDALLATDPRNPDAWWIYAYAVDDPAEAQRALQTVLQLDPEYPEAADLLSNLNEQYPELVEARAVEALAESTPPEPPAELPIDEEPEFLPPPETAIPEPPTRRVKKEKRSNLPLWIALIAAIILILIALLLLRPAEPTTTTAGLSTATSGTDQSTPGTEVTLEATSLTVIDTGNGTQVTLLGVTPLVTAIPLDGSSTQDGVVPEVTGETVVLEVTPLEATSGEVATGSSEAATPEQGAEAGTETGLVPTSESGTSGETGAAGTEAVGTTVVLQVTPLDAISGEQTPSTSEITALEQVGEAGTETALLPTTESGTSGETGTTGEVDATALVATSAAEQATTGGEIATPDQSADAATATTQADTGETGTTGEVDATALAATSVAEQTTGAAEVPTTEQSGETGTETALVPTTESGASGEGEGTATETGGEVLPLNVTATSQVTEETLSLEATTEAPQGIDATAEGTEDGAAQPTAVPGTGDATTSPESEATGGADTTPTSESFVVEATLAESPAETSEAEATELQPTLEAGQGTGGELTALQGLEQSLNDAQISNYAITGLVTDMGNALIVTVCAEEGPELRETLIPVMNIVAQNTPAQDVRFTAVGTEVISCGNPTQTLRVIAIQRAIAEAYANGDLTDEEFQATWRSL